MAGPAGRAAGRAGARTRPRRRRPPGGRRRVHVGVRVAGPRRPRPLRARPPVIARAGPTGDRVVDARDAGRPSRRRRRRAAAALRAGEVVALPTDTVYGLAALPASAAHTGRLFALKGRAADVPVAVLCASPDQAPGAGDPAAVTAPTCAGSPARLWPGPLTLVLPRRPGLGLRARRAGGTIGVRCPDHPLVRALAAEVGPLATTSANLHGEPTPPDAAGVADGVRRRRRPRARRRALRGRRRPPSWTARGRSGGCCGPGP